MIRNPIDRIISLYFQILRDRTHYFYSKVAPISFEDFIKKNEFNLATENQQIRFLLGEGYTSKSTNVNDLIQAKKNLEHFSVVGLMKRFNGSLFLMKQHLGRRDIYYRRANVRPRKTALTQNMLLTKMKELILEKNKLDYELFNYVNPKLDVQINELDLKAKEELSIFYDEY